MEDRVPSGSLAPADRERRRWGPGGGPQPCPTLFESDIP